LSESVQRGSEDRGTGMGLSRGVRRSGADDSELGLAVRESARRGASWGGLGRHGLQRPARRGWRLLHPIRARRREARPSCPRTLGRPLRQVSKGSDLDHAAWKQLVNRVVSIVFAALLTLFVFSSLLITACNKKSNPMAPAPGADVTITITGNNGNASYS